MRKLRQDWIQRKPAIIRSRTVLLPVCYPKPQRFKYTEIIVFLLFYMGGELGLSYWGMNTGWLFENRVLRRIFGPKRDEVTGEWRKLHSVKLQWLLLTRYCYNEKIRENEMGGAWKTHWEKRNADRVLVQEQEGKRTLGRSRRRWEYNIKVVLKMWDERA